MAVRILLPNVLSVACFVLALAAFVPAATAAPPKNKPDFTRYVLAKIKGRLPGAELMIEQPLGLSVRYANGGVGRISMLRIWEFCAANDLCYNEESFAESFRQIVQHLSDAGVASRVQAPLAPEGAAVPTPSV